MVKKHIFLVMVFFTGIIYACNKKSGPLAPPPDPCFYNGIDTCIANAPLKLTINLADEKQTIHSFGASDCWTGKFIGKWNDESKKNKIADYLFSTDTLADGSPKGIGLSIWRFNIGAGSFEQGSGSGIPEDWRREESFLNSDGTYDWSKQGGQQWFLNAARIRNVKYVTGFSVSAPVSMTRDGKAHGGGGKSFNIATGKMPEFANFLSTVSNHFKFDYISPFNEPQWNWGDGSPSQEGTAATNTEIADLVKILGPKLEMTNSTTKIIVGEAAQLNFLSDAYENDRGNQISNWFSASSGNYIGNVKNVEKTISGHSYFTTCPDNNLINIRTAVDNKRNSIDPALNIWQTEFGILGDVCGKYNGYPRNTTIDYGLYVAKTIHHDLVYTNVSSWQWWLAMNPFDYSDGLVYINDPTGSINVNNSKNDGIVLDSKQLWSMGNFSRFVRPGMKRITATIDGIDPIQSANSQMISAYKDPVKKKFTIVIINVSASEKKCTLDTDALKLASPEINVFTTTGSKNLQKSTIRTNKLVLEGRSITTLTGFYQ